MRVPPSSLHSTDLLAHADALFGFAFHLSASSVEAEDLLQETYARALRSIDGFEPGTNLKAWLFRILRNVWIDAVRSSARHPTSSDAEGGDLDRDPSCGAERSLLRDDEELERMRSLVGTEIEAALRTLSEDARTVVLLDVEGFTESEIATLMECAVGTVKSRLSRARAALGKRLAEYRR